MMKPSTVSAKASTVTRSRIFVISRLVPRQSRKKVQRTGDEDGRVLTRARQRRDRVGLDLDLREVVRREVRELGCRERARVVGLGGDEAACLGGERRQHRVRVLVA